MWWKYSQPNKPSIKMHKTRKKNNAVHLNLLVPQSPTINTVNTCKYYISWPSRSIGPGFRSPSWRICGGKAPSVARKCHCASRQSWVLQRKSSWIDMVSDGVWWVQKGIAARNHQKAIETQQHSAISGRFGMFWTPNNYPNFDLTNRPLAKDPRN
jgi:hypothetical protein